MATTAPIVRQPFGELSSSRVQQLASAKNRQNGFIAKSSPLSGKPVMAPTKTAAKRPFVPSTYEDTDSENVDPSLFSPSKKSKSDASDTTAKPFTFSMTPVKSMPPPSAISARNFTPTRANMSSPRAPLTAPAGRSPKRKFASSRRISAPFTRIDPPFSTTAASTLPFSLDAALQGTMSTSTTTKTTAGSTIKESKPASYFFEIYEDTPEEEAAILMEHSTLTLDLSSDDETKKAEKMNRGKENTPPEGYDAPSASRAVATPTHRVMPAPSRVKKTDLIRRKITEMDDGERSPLSDLETEPFIPDGLDKDSHVVVDALVEKKAFDVNDLFATAPATVTFGGAAKEKKSSPVKDLSAVNASDDITIFEDDAEAAPEAAVEAAGVEAKEAQELVKDENAAPQEDVIA